MGRGHSGFQLRIPAWARTQDALDALWVGMVRKKANWILDLDIRSFFDKLQPEWLVQFVEHRVGDRGVVRLIQKWLKAGVVEDGKWFQTEEGSPDHRRRRMVGLSLDKVCSRLRFWSGR